MTSKGDEESGGEERARADLYRAGKADLVGVRLRIRGRVQGVFYRKTTEEKANSLGLAGWVRNMSDGSVEAFAVGMKEELNVLIEWCRKGPPGARVETVEVDWRQANREDCADDERIQPGGCFFVTGSW